MLTELLSFLDFVGLSPQTLTPFLLFFLLLDKRIDTKLKSIKDDISEINKRLGVLERAVIEIQSILINTGYRLKQIVHPKNGF